MASRSRYACFAALCTFAMGAGAWPQSKDSKRIMADVVQPLLNALLLLKYPDHAPKVCAIINNSLAEARLVRNNSDAHSWELPNGNAELTRLATSLGVETTTGEYASEKSRLLRVDNLAARTPQK